MSPSVLLYPTILSIVGGIMCFVIPGRRVKEGICIAFSLAVLILAILIFSAGNISLSYSWLTVAGINFALRSYRFSSFILLFIGLFSFLISLYSVKFMSQRHKQGRIREYYCYLLLTTAAAAGAVLAANLVVFLLFWGVLGVLLYAFLSLGSSRLSTKGLFIIGTADFALILGALFFYYLTGSLNIPQAQPLAVNSGLAAAAFILLVIGAIAKAGAIPFHGWIPDAADKVPTPVMALLPASLDKLLGIYFLARICFDLFKLIPNSYLSILLMFIGSLTVVVAVMMALLSSDMKKLIAYLNISSAGYMAIGIATGNPLGIAGGLFYLLGTTLWTSLLFLTAGCVENRTGVYQFSSLGGLARWMPLTFTVCAIGGLSVSGIPPFVGFFSKWMIYQGIVQLSTVGGWGNMWIIWLLAAMFGSALTLASFMKLVHGTFLSSESDQIKEKVSQGKIREVGISMLFPLIVLAGLCVAFGVFAYQLPLRLFILPSLPSLPSPATWIGWWEPGVATVLIILGAVIGAIIYLVGKVKLGRASDTYVGGEAVSPGMRISGVDFYDTIRDFTGLRRLYTAAERGALDVYRGMLSFSRGVARFLWAVDRLTDLLWTGLSRVVLIVGRGCSLAHTGILHTYLAWYLLGLVILLLIFLLGGGG